ncbi:hypothetical protein CU044_1256 [Streptomyces sp. L-9-10]|uniref:hypothetical protein n=1 Tax=Streptomyces sp. L-9-10 TaxID=1478131 RepID=UPI0010EB95DB|nr:hypothetical protein [Streptomyces sp. L-9-10]RYJ30521.1 hypothetical protein CU044_1256 [Streptomyces sp. L-9-10]
MSDEQQAAGSPERNPQPADQPRAKADRAKPDRARADRGRADRAKDDRAQDNRAGDERARARDNRPRAEEGRADSDRDSGGSDAAEKEKEEQSEQDREEREKEEREKEERERERERVTGRFKEHTRDPLAEEQGDDGPTDLAAASRARHSTRMLFDTGRDLNSFDRSFIQSAHIGDIHLRLDSRPSAAGMRSGPVPEDELRGLRRVHVEPQGYVRLRSALVARRLLVLGAAPGTGRTSTALSLLDEVTSGAGAEPGAGPRVSRVDPDGGVRGLAGLLSGDGAEDRRGTGYLLELALTRPGSLPPDAMDLDGLAAALDGCGAFAVIVVTLGSAANPLLTGRYGMICPPAPTQELLTTRLREKLEERREELAERRDGLAERREGLADHTAAAPDGAPAAGPDMDDLLAAAEELAQRAEVRDAVGLKDLRPAEAGLQASLLAGHLLGDLSYDELLSGCRSLAAGQAQEWFAGVDRALAALPAAAADGGAGRSGTAALFHPVAFRIALAVLGGTPHSTVAAAAHLLTWELSVQSDPDTTPARPLFCDDPESDLALSRAELLDGRVEVAGAEVDARLIWYRGSALPAAVLAEIWDRHFPVRAPLVRWLRLLSDDPRPHVWMRAAVAAGELSVRDFDHSYAELIRPLAEAATPRRRIFAATTMDQAAGHASHREAVRKLVGDWSRFGTKSLRWTAAMALGYGNAAATTDDALDALARIGVRDDGDQLAAASFNVVRLLALPDVAKVLRRMADWTHHQREAYQDLGLVTTVRMALTGVDEVPAAEPGSPLGDRGDWPLPLALAATRPELVLPMADLLWTALNTPRSKDVAMDALEALMRTAVRKDGTEWTRPGLAALLPALAAEEHDRRRLDWLLRRMMNDPENPLPDAQARSLWWLAVPSPDRTGEEERHG